MLRQLKEDFYLITSRISLEWNQFYKNGEFNDIHRWGEGRNIYAENLINRKSGTKE